MLFGKEKKVLKKCQTMLSANDCTIISGIKAYYKKA
jgi:hypothetical protein